MIETQAWIELPAASHMVNQTTAGGTEVVKTPTGYPSSYVRADWIVSVHVRKGTDELEGVELTVVGFMAGDALMTGLTPQEVIDRIRRGSGANVLVIDQ